MKSGLSILIVARNAAATIERAVRSAISDQTLVEVILVDDRCNDDTVKRAIHASDRKIRVIRSNNPSGLPIARQCAIDAVDTKYAAWLDADDEWIEGRATRILGAFDKGYDIVVDSIELFDGCNKKKIKLIRVPDFLVNQEVPIRLFERNYLPGDTQVGFRVSLFRELGYDPNLFGVESFDILLRALKKGAKFAYLQDVGYRMYSYPGSISRNIFRQREILAKTLRKHDYSEIRRLSINAGYPQKVCNWILVSMALYRYEPEKALSFLDSKVTKDGDENEVIEPDGPYPVTECWRSSFTRGTCFAMLKKFYEAKEFLIRAERMHPTAEGANNLGVIFTLLGEYNKAYTKFRQALKRFPDYFDATVNLNSRKRYRITTHPLRRLPSRSNYC